MFIVNKELEPELNQEPERLGLKNPGTGGNKRHGSDGMSLVILSVALYCCLVIFTSVYLYIYLYVCLSLTLTLTLMHVLHYFTFISLAMLYTYILYVYCAGTCV